MSQKCAKDTFHQHGTYPLSHNFNVGSECSSNVLLYGVSDLGQLWEEANARAHALNRFGHH